MTKYNETEVQSMTYNGKEVDVWIHNGVEVYSGKTQLKYVVTFSKNTAGDYPVNIKIYSMKDDSLIEEANFGTSSNYHDGFVKVEWGSLVKYRWIFTPLVDGTSTLVEGSANKGSDYGGTAEQFVPITNTTCIISFITTGKYNAVNIIAQPTS